MKRALLLPLVWLVSACTLMPAGQSNLYELRREAQSAYAGAEDERAEKLLLGLSRAAPNDPETWFYLGNLYARTNRPEQAIAAYQKSLMLKGDDARAWHNMGVVRLREAWAAFIQAHNLASAGDPLQARLEQLIKSMETMPLEGLNRNAKQAPGASPPAAGAKQ